LIFLRYKERLQTKYIKARRPSETDKNLVGKNWLFLKDGLDDFRDGLPPPVEGDITLKVSLLHLVTSVEIYINT
jgi:hypothetical protein